jgi:hypothetical protein
VGNDFYGSKGYKSVSRTAYNTFLGKDHQPGPANNAAGDNWENYIQAVRSRKRSDLNADIEEGAMSATLVHLANISYRLGRTLHLDSDTLMCKGDDEANSMFTRKYRAPFVVPENV